MHHIPGRLSLVLLDIGKKRQKHPGICRQQTFVNVDCTFQLCIIDVEQMILLISN